ncbi:MAG: glycosyltransferase family 2 protein, partial [Bdellovibrionales bacterium]
MMAPLHIFERVDINAIPQGLRECRAIFVTRNEAQRLPWLLRYYRGLGVDRFFVVDNGSTDGSVDFLLRQKDCHVFVTHDSYTESGFGHSWQQIVLDMYGEDNWWLIVDADEVFVYPDSETVPLPQFTHYLDSLGAQGVS